MSPKNMATVYKNMTALTFNGFIRDLYTTFGMFVGGIRLMWQASDSQADMVPNPNSRKVHLGEDVHRQQLLPGDQLDDVIAKYLA